jgi:hypothetical protein
VKRETLQQQEQRVGLLMSSGISLSCPDRAQAVSLMARSTPAVKDRQRVNVSDFDFVAKPWPKAGKNCHYAKLRYSSGCELLFSEPVFAMTVQRFQHYRFV